MTIQDFLTLFPSPSKKFLSQNSLTLYSPKPVTSFMNDHLTAFKSLNCDIRVANSSSIDAKCL